MRIAIFDIDGTLADSRHRDHLRPLQPFGDWSKFIAPDVVAKDAPIAMSWSILEGLAALMPIHFVSGRYESQRQVTRDWLETHGASCGLVADHSRLHLRPDGDRTRSFTYKGGVLKALKESGVSPVFAAEDNAKDAEIYKAAGLSVFRCCEVNKARRRVTRHVAPRLRTNYYSE